MPDYKRRKSFFLAQWQAKIYNIQFIADNPLLPETKEMEFLLYVNGNIQKLKVAFKPYQSIMLKKSIQMNH